MKVQEKLWEKKGGGMAVKKQGVEGTNDGPLRSHLNVVHTT